MVITSLSNLFDRNKTSMKLTLYQSFAGNRYKNMIKQLSKSELYISEFKFLQSFKIFYLHIFCSCYKCAWYVANIRGSLRLADTY